jgi:uncharacterized protein (DUF302 family)
VSYYLAKTVRGAFEEVVDRAVAAFKQEGFGVLTEIDVRETLKKKLGVEFRKYRILGMCNPPFAYQALQAEDKIGTMLPCSVVVQEAAGGEVEVAAIDPLASMQAVGNPALAAIGAQVRAKLARAVAGLH